MCSSLRSRSRTAMPSHNTRPRARKWYGSIHIKGRTKRRQSEWPHGAYRATYRVERSGVSLVEKCWARGRRSSCRRGAAKRRLSPAFVTLSSI